MSETPATPTAPVQGAGLKPDQIGVAQLVAFVVACAAPLTLMAGVAPVAISLGGVVTPSGYLLAAVVLGLFAVGYVAMSRHIRNAGAFYAFVGEGLGRPAGTASAFLALAAYFFFTIGQIAGCAVFAQTAIRYFTGVAVPWPPLALAVALAIGALGYRQVNLSGRILGVALLLEVAVLTVLVIAVLLRGGANGITFGSFDPTALVGPGTGAMLVFAFGAFLGIEATAIYSEEAREPRRTVPRATYIAVALLGVFYTVVCWAVIVAFGESNVVAAATQDPAGLFFVAMDDYVGSAATGLMHVMLFVSIFASTLAFHNESTRYLFALGRERVLPGWLSRTHPTHGSPVSGVKFQMVVVVVVLATFALVGSEPYFEIFIYLASAAVVAIIATQVLCSAAVIAYFRRDPRETTIWQRLIAPALGLAGLSVALWLMIANFDLLTGAPTLVNVLLLGPLAAAFVIGLIRGIQLKRKVRA